MRSVTVPLTLPLGSFSESVAPINPPASCVSLTTVVGAEGGRVAAMPAASRVLFLVKLDAPLGGLEGFALLRLPRFGGDDPAGGHSRAAAVRVRTADGKRSAIDDHGSSWVSGG